MPAATLWIDAGAGIAGDMLLGALLDAGASLAYVRQQVAAVVQDAVAIEVASVQRAGLRAAHAVVAVRAVDPPRRTWVDVRRLLDGAVLDDAVHRDATAVFARLAAAEAGVHGIAADEVHFHEVGALDALADVVGVCAALHDLAVDTVTVSPIALGSGTVTAAHGTLPVPVPAVLELVRDRPVLAGGVGELATPTGVALATTLAPTSGFLPAMTVRRVGIGAGSRDRAGRANVVRAVLGTAAPAATGHDAELVLETNVDDLDPRAWPAVLDALLAAGARDAWLTPILMKKGRPAHTLHVLAAATDGDALRDLIVEHTSAIGVRTFAVAKYALVRGWREVEVGGGRVRVKIASRDGRIVRVSAEYEDAAATAQRLGRPVAEVLADAERAAAAQGWRPGAPAS